LLLESPALPAAPISFSRDLAPILHQKCVTCHGPEKSKGKLRLDSFDWLQQPGDSGEPAVVAGQPEKSELYRRLTATDPDDRMPQKDDPLPAAQIVLFEQWIKEGALFDGPNPKAPLASLLPRAPHPEPPTTYPRPVPVTALAFSPDGSELAVSGYHEVTIGEAINGTLKRRLKRLPERIHSFAWKADGSVLAVAGGAPGQWGELLLVDPQSGNIRAALATTSDVLLTTAFSPDAARLAAGGADNTIRLFDIAGRKELLVIQQHADWVMALAWSPDGAKLASASRDRTARVYDAKTGELETTFSDHNAPVQAVAFSPDGKQALTAGRDKRVLVWNVEDGKKAADIGGFEDEILQLAVSEGNLWSASADGRVRQHALTDRKLLATYAGHTDRVYSLAVHAATKRVAAGSHAGEVRVWETGNTDALVAFVAAPGLKVAAGK
jgi:WD40 repeat protein